MSCRTLPAGSLGTTFVQRRYGLKDAQCTSLFHALIREARREGHTVTSREYHDAVDQMEAYIRTNPLFSGSRGQRALQRVNRVRGSAMPSDAAVAWAFTRIDSQAGQAQAMLSLWCQHIARAQSMTVDAVRAEFDRLAAAPDRTAARSLSTVDPLLPCDAGTRWAMHVLLSGTRCAACGQFSAAGGPHTCPSANATSASSNTANPGQATAPEPVEEDDTASARVALTITPTGARAPTRGTNWAENMDAFQKVYDDMKARWESGERAAPVFPHLEEISGGVTGGLGQASTFGLEIEFDFPDEDWPYSNRDLFAESLHARGVVMNPETLRWHFVGDEGAGRPGGTFRRTAFDWSCESDRSVDMCDGERGVEIKSQILVDEPDTWRNLRQITEEAARLGGRTTMRCGLHVNVGADGFPSDDPAPHTRLLRLAATFDDTLVRLAHNPAHGPTHRGRTYCTSVSVPPRGFDSVDVARAYANHYQAFNLGHLPSATNPATSTSRIEVRLFDGSLDPGRIQAQTALTLALVAAARNGVETADGPELAGAHRSRFGTRRLSGAEWEDSTRSFRRLVDVVSGQGLNRPEHLQMLTWLFVSGRWQRQ